MATEVASLTALLSLDDSGFVRGMRNASEQISGISGTFQNMGNSLKNLGGNLQSMGMQATMATAPIAAMGAVGIKAYGDFESVINEISARTGIVGDELQSISDYALEMGAATVFSGQQASEAFLDLLTSGQSAEEAFATLPQVMSLAAAGGIELGQSADTLTDIMSMFGLAASDTVGNLSAAEYVANSLTQASQVSSASVSMLGDAFVNVGGIASGFGLSVDTTNAALAVLAEGGLKGAEAGTNLKSMLLGMSSTTNSTQEAWTRLGTSMYDSEGNMKNLNSLLGEIRTGLEDLPVSEQNEIIMGLAGSYGQLSLRTLLFGNDLAATQGAMEEAASASEVAEKMMASWNNQVGSLMGSLESLAISVMGPFVEDTMKPLVAQAIEVVNSIKLWADENPELAQTIVKLAAAAVVIGPILLGIGTAVSIVGTAIAGLGTILGIVLSPIGLLVAAVAALAVAFVTDFGGIRTWFNANILPWLVGLADAFTIGGWENAWTYIQGVFIKPLIAGFKSLVSGGQVAQDLQAFGENVLNNLSSGLSNIGTWLNDTIIKPLVTAVRLMVAGAGGAGAIFKKLQAFGFKLLSTGFGFAKNIVQFVWKRLFKPIGDAIGKYINSGQLQKTAKRIGASLMKSIRDGIGRASEILAVFNSTVIQPLIWSIKKYINSGQLQKTLEKLGGMFMDAIRAGIGLVGQGLTWIYDNLIKPLGDAVSNYVTSGQLMDNLRSLGDMFMRAIGAGINLLGQGLTWVYENLIKPLGDAIFQYIDSGQLADTLVSLGTGFLDLIGKGITFVQGIPAWIYDNLIKPLFTSIGGETGSGGGLWDSLMGFGSSILEGIGQGLNMLGGVATWIWDSVINPFITGMAEHVGLGEIWEKLKAFGGSILEGIGAGLTYIQNIGAWLYNTLIAPLVGGLTVEGGTTGDLWQSLLSLGGIFLEAVGAGLELIVSIGVWFRDTFIGPIIDAIGNFLGVGELYDTLVDFGSGFLEWIAEGIGNVSQWIHETIVKPMGDAINGVLVSLGFLPDPRFIGYYDSPSSGGAGQSSRRYGGSVMANQPYMVGEVGPELFVPSASGTIIPNNELSSRVEIQQIVINAPSGDAREIASAFEIELSEIMRGRG
jgi:TP901 family phage tail tape measure protein